ncbi:tripartite tricarboxylate transporter substrate-binding protein [Variovorax paradoxus]|jgi:tripartite-type tricarboxylate transporter receptor subunit TctC|uniref:Bug family tripartite tricarboxylate transporter substrate binding protein n=1 Tax=Variovorax paradoxus TaxID=34073 RepID=UPI00042351CD
MRRRHLLQAGALCVWSAIDPSARAEGYPSKPVQVVVPFPPGGTNDLLARVLAQSLGELMPGSFVIDNRAGGGAGSVGAQAVAAARPVGYTLLLGNTASLAINRSVYPNLRYDPQRDFQPISVVGSSSLVLVVNSKVPTRNVAEFVQLLRSSPAQNSYASAGAGSPLHLAGELFKYRTGTEMLHVPYRGTAPAYTDLLSGRISAMFDNTTTAVQHTRAGTIRALAVTGARRSALFPQVPTLAEEGFKDMEVLVWFGLVAPKSTDAALIGRLSQAVATMAKAEETRRRLLEFDIEPWGSTPEEMRRFLASESAKWKTVVQRSNIRLE